MGTLGMGVVAVAINKKNYVYGRALKTEEKKIIGHCHYFAACVAIKKRLVFHY